MRTCRGMLCGLLLMMLVPGLTSAGVTLSQQIITGAAQSGEGGSIRLDGSLGGLVMHQASGGTLALAQGFWFPGQVDTTDVGVSGDPRGEFRFRLDQNVPNPFNPRTAIAFTVPGADSLNEAATSATCPPAPPPRATNKASSLDGCQPTGESEAPCRPCATGVARRET